MRRTKPKTAKPDGARDKKPGGGKAIGGGVNFQAIAIAIVGVHILRGTALGWLDGLANDLPVAVWAESEGPGDDIRVELESGRAAEIQAKKGLQRGSGLWTSLEDMATAIHKGLLDFGVLVVAPDSSGSIRIELAEDVERLGHGRRDHLTDIGKDLATRLAKIGVSAEDACRCLRIRVVHGLASDGADVKAAKETLRLVCVSEDQVDAAWDALYRQAVLLTEQRGRWTLRDLRRLLASVGVDIRNSEAPISILDRLTKWTLSTNADFQITGTRRPILLKNLLPMRIVPVPFEDSAADDASAALTRYHQRHEPQRDQKEFDARWTARFRKRVVVVAGPGVGKSTMLKELAHQYAEDSHPVLKVSLKAIAAAVRNGTPFSDALISHALSGSGISSEQLERVGSRGWVVLADGLDDCGAEHHAVAEALKGFALGHPTVRIVVTTRPIGYSSAELNTWSHYRIVAPKKDDGAANLGMLVEAAAEKGPLKSEGKDIARRELRATPAGDAIAISPQLLGMAASLIVRDGVLPTTRPQLYERLIRLFEELPSLTSTGRPVSQMIAKRVLDVIGWTLVEEPLITVEQLVGRCSAMLAPELGETTLAAAAVVEDVLSHWERVGLVERVHHDGTSLLTFIHKTFAEFVAARFVIAMPVEEREGTLDRLVNLSEWSEVIGFAGGLGLGDAIAQLYVNRRASGYRGQLERALALAGDRDASVSDGLTKTLVEIVFEAVEHQDDDRFTFGIALADLASKRPAIVGPSAVARLDATDVDVKLVAWAAAVECGPDVYEPSAVADVLRELLPHVSAGMTGSLLGGLRLSEGKDRELMQRVAIAALNALPDGQLKAFVENELSNSKLDTIGFRSEVDAVLRARGIPTGDGATRMRRPSINLFDILTPPDQWRQALRSAFYALAKAVAPNRPLNSTGQRERQFIQFAGLIAITGFRNVVVSDMYEWTKPFDKQAVRSTLGALVQVSALDANALAEEASDILRRMDADPMLDPFDLQLPDVDVPEPEWGNVVNVAVERKTLEKAMLHTSVWMVHVAANLLESLPISQGDLVSLLNQATGTSLMAAAFLVQIHDPRNAVTLLTDRLERDLSGDVGAIFDILREAAAEPSPRLVATTTRAFVMQDVRTCKAAVALLADLVDRGGAIDSEAIVKAVEHWRKREPESKSNGIIPDSPRSDLLGLLVKLGAIDVSTMLPSLNDKRSDVRRVAEKWLLERIGTSQEVTDKVLECIIQQRMPPAIAASILRSPFAISGNTLDLLEGLLAAPDPKWRRAAMSILNPRLMSPDRLADHARRLMSDPEKEISRAAEKLLANVSV